MTPTAPPRAPRLPPFDLILITEPQLADPVSLMRRALAVDVVNDTGMRIAVQLRAKTWSPSERRDAAQALREITRATHSALLINGDPSLCREVGADGVQLPSDGPSIHEARAHLGDQAWIGASCHDLNELERAERNAADFALLSPWATVPDKAPALGPDTFAALTRSRQLAVIALGGIGLGNMADAIAHGACGVAVIRDLHQARDPADWVQRALVAIDQAKRLRPVD